MSHSRSSSWPRLTALVLSMPFLMSACDTRKPATGSGSKAVGPNVDGQANALAGLETHQDLARCRTALQQLDAQEGAGSRPTLSEAERTEITRLLRLTPGEIAELGQATFSQADAAYLEECLLVRAGVRALRIESRPPLERARLGFDWACRMVYIDDRIPWPANPWTTLQGGSGLALSRAYVVLAVWQQLGLDSCLVGPPALKAAPSLVVNQLGSEVVKATYAPIRACGVRIGDDLFLFDAATGLPLPAAGGKDVLTLAAARQAPEAVKGPSADEVKTWQPFLAPSLSAMSRRMEWLEQRNPAGAGVKLHVNLVAQKARFGPTCDVWDPDGDPYSAARVLARFAGEETTTKQKGALRDHHRLLMTPLDRLPKTALSGRALEELTGAFLSQFGALRYGPNSARDLLLRGQYREAISALEDVKRTVDNARTRADQDPDIEKEFARWTVELQALSARVLRPDPGDPGGAQAQRDLQAFRSNPRNRDTEQSFVLGQAARPLAAEVTFLMAQCVHERAERARAEGGAQAQGPWRNAAEWWQRFLDASAQANSPFPAREPHARDLLARCQQFAGKGP